MRKHSPATDKGGTAIADAFTQSATAVMDPPDIDTRIRLPEDTDTLSEDAPRPLLPNMAISRVDSLRLPPPVMPELGSRQIDPDNAPRYVHGVTGLEVVTRLQVPHEPVDDTPELILPLATYRWEIPHAQGDDYLLPIEVCEAASPEDARRAALEIAIPTGGMDDDGQRITRPLTTMERMFVDTQSPVVIRDTEAITIDHFRAMTQNTDLKAKAAAVEAATLALGQTGVDVNNPLGWVNQMRTQALQDAQAAAGRLAQDRQSLCNGLLAMSAQISTLIDSTGFAPPKPLPTPEPDYSKISVVCDPDKRQNYPLLSSANWIDHSPIEPMSEAEQSAWDLLMRPDTGIFALWRLTAYASQGDAENVEHLKVRLRALVEG